MTWTRAVTRSMPRGRGRWLLRISLRIYRLLFYPVYWLSGLMPRDANLWLFGARNGRKFEGNSKWLYLHVSRHQPGIRAVWITRRPEIVEMLRREGLLAHQVKSPMGVWSLLRARVYVFMLNSPDVSYWTSRGAFRANLQHGTPYKRFGRDVVDPRNPLYVNHNGSRLQRLSIRLGIPSTYERVDFVSSVSCSSSEHWARALGVSRSCVVETGNPRSDVLLTADFRPDPWDREWFERFEARRSSGKCLIAYLPTFRVGEGAGRDVPIDWQRFERFLVDHDMHLWVRWHPGDARPQPDCERFEAIDLVPGDVDLDPLLRLTDLLVTDYSSVYLDFLVLDRPIVFFAYDRDAYLSDGKTLYEPYEDLAAGPIVATFDALLDALARAEQAPEHADGRAALCARFHEHVDAGASRRVFEAIDKRLSEP